MRPLERRINKLEQAMGDLPCKNTKHSGLTIFMYGITREQDEENDRLRESLRQCPRCSQGDQVMSIIFGKTEAAPGPSTEFFPHWQKPEDLN